MLYSQPTTPTTPTHAARGTRHANTQTASRGICALVERPAPSVSRIKYLESPPTNSTSIETNKQGVRVRSKRPISYIPKNDSKKLEKFIVAYWEKNKSVPSVRKMCDALKYDTCAKVSALLHRMRGFSPLVLKRKRDNIAVIGDAEAWRDAWKKRNYLRYRSLKLTRNFIACYHYRRAQLSIFSSLSRKVLK